MDNKFYIKLFAYIFGIMIICPIIINSLMFAKINLLPVKGDYQIWAPVLGTFWGAILGGAISGVLTLLGVKKTIEASFRALEESREKDIEIATAKERLKELYQPVESLFLEFTFKYGAHTFGDLTHEDRISYITLLNKNILYADSSLRRKFTELKWAHNAIDIQNVNELYNKINEIIGEEIEILRERFKLP